MPKALLVLLLLFWTSVAAGATFPQTAEPYLSIWEDKAGRTDFAALDDKLFAPATADHLNAGFTSSIIWLRLDLQNPQSYPLQRFFEIELDTISLFDVYQRDQAEPLLSGGQKRPWNPRFEHRHPVVDVALPPGARGTWYIRLQNNYSLSIIAWLHSTDSLADKEAREGIIVGTYSGFIGIAFILSLYVYFATRHASFFLFAIMLLSYHLGFQLTRYGLSWMSLWPNATSWADRATYVFIELSSIAGIFLFRNSLDLPRTLPWLNRWLWIPILKSLVGLAWCFISFTPKLVGPAIMFAGPLMLCYIVAGIYLWRKGYSPAIYFTLGWLTVILFNVLSILQATDLVRFDQPWFRSALRFELSLVACVLQAAFLAIAIGDQFKKIQKDWECERLARRKLEKNLDDAHIVQEAFIPHDLKSQLFEIVTSHHPSAKIGGDWLGYHHDVIHKRLILAICDVTGHGLPAALLSGAIHGAFHGLARAEELDALQGPELLAMLMQRINGVVCMTAANTSLLATMLILAIDLETGRIDYSNAGHTPIVLLRDDRPVFILQGGSPLGLQNKPSFGVGTYQGQAGDIVFLYTDGLLDNSRSARRLQVHHLTRLLSTQEPLSTLQKRLEELTGPATTTMEDDSSYIICRLQSA